MFREGINWIKNNKFLTLLAAVFVLAVVFYTDIFSTYTYPHGTGRTVSMDMSGYEGLSMPAPMAMMERAMPSRMPHSADYTPTETTDRMVVTDASLAMVVDDVAGVQNSIIAKAEELGGYMVSTSLIHPEEAPYARVEVRVLSENLRSAMDYYRSLGVKVTSERVYGRDVTDQYMDLEARLESLMATKARFEEIRTAAETVDELVNVQRELSNLQNQIDWALGQQQYLEQTAKLSKITIDLSTDELALPYTPSETFRPSVIFKQAVRSLIGTFYSLAEWGIWIAVYSPIWVPLAGGVYLWRRRRSLKRGGQSMSN